ncbi:hypothetical protein M8494_04645 [Serratia ureilytica]
MRGVFVAQHAPPPATAAAWKSGGIPQASHWTSGKGLYYPSIALWRRCAEAAPGIYQARIFFDPDRGL